MATIRAHELDIDLPPDWVEHPNPGGPIELRPRKDGATGLLQLSRFSDDDFAFIAAQPDLNAFTASFADGLGRAGHNWGTATGTRGGPCTMGRFSICIRSGGEFPAMFVWITVAHTAAFLWTWLGPSPTAPEVQQALTMVLTARSAA